RSSTSSSTPARRARRSEEFSPMPDSLTIQNGKIAVVTEEGQRFERPEAQLVEMLRGELLPPLGAAALPDGVKFHEWRPPFLCLVHQLPPHVRQCRWIAPDSPKRFRAGGKYPKVRLSFPYALTFPAYFPQGKHPAPPRRHQRY